MNEHFHHPNRSTEHCACAVPQSTHAETFEPGSQEATLGRSNAIRLQFYRGRYDSGGGGGMESFLGFGFGGDAMLPNSAESTTPYQLTAATGEHKKV